MGRWTRLRKRVGTDFVDTAFLSAPNTSWKWKNHPLSAKFPMRRKYQPTRDFESINIDPITTQNQDKAT